MPSRGSVCDSWYLYRFVTTVAYEISRQSAWQRRTSRVERAVDDYAASQYGYRLRDVLLLQMSWRSVVYLQASRNVFVSGGYKFVRTLYNLIVKVVCLKFWHEPHLWLGEYRGYKCRNPGVQFHLSAKFAYKKLVWVAFAEVCLSVCVMVFDRRNRIIHYNSYLA